MNAPRARLVLVTLMAATLVAFAAPACADRGHDRGRHRGPDQRDREITYSGWRAMASAVRHAPPAYCPPPARGVVQAPACPPPAYRAPSGIHLSFSGVVGGVGIDADYQRALPGGEAYYDPYCNVTFHSLAGYAEHCWNNQHPAEAQVIPAPANCERWDWSHRNEPRDGRDRGDDGQDWGR